MTGYGAEPAPLDPVVCERAGQARDARFDGRFYIGVTTTGVYCRPICPVRLPRAQNVRFYPSAAAAAEAGFRPCLRCRPESSPGAPAARGTGATVTRALRLIEEGAMDRAGVEALAARLGLGARHLGRLFVHHLGASPVQVAQTRRLHLAVKLIDETSLRMTEIAHASGFGSVRRFNEAVAATYGRPPSSLRRRGAAARGSRLRLELSYRPPLPWHRVTAFLAQRALPGVEAVDGDRYRRTIALGERAGVIEMAPIPGQNKLELLVEFPDVAALATIVARVRSALDLDADPATIEGDLCHDPALSRRVARIRGLRVIGAFDGFELAVRAVIGQAISVAAARTLATRLVARFGSPLSLGSSSIDGRGTSRVFPGPQALAEADLDGLGIAPSRVRAIHAIARAVAGGELDLASSVDLDGQVQSLRSLPGVGPWTAHYIAMRAGRHPDAFPSSDLGLRGGAARCLLRKGAAAPSARALEQRAERWRPWRAYAAMHLWSAYAEASLAKVRPARRAAAR